MANRFQNTAQDLRDCYEHMDDDLSLDEARARIELVKLCAQIAAHASAEVSLWESEIRRAEHWRKRDAARGRGDDR